MSGGLAFFVKGIVLGFSIAAPVGPIGVLCMRRTLGSGMLHGFLSGMGAATADGLYGCLAAFGVTAISNLLLEQQSLIRLAGTILSFGAVFAGLGIGAARGNSVLAGLMVSGVVAGSALWWLTLSGIVSVFREKLDHGQLRWVNRSSGAIIGCFGVASLVSLLHLF